MCSQTTRFAPRGYTVRLPKLKTIAALGFALMLAACGGGGGGTDATTPPSGGDSGGNYTPGTGGGTAMLSWSAPTERMDGQPLAVNEIGGYRIYFGPLSSPSEFVIEVTDGSAEQYQVTGLAQDTYTFAVAVFDTSGSESAPSNSMTKVIN